MLVLTEPGVHEVTVKGPTQLLKPLLVSTPIPVPGGWVELGDLEAGDEVFGDDGKICRVIKTTAPVLSDRCYSLQFECGTEITATEDHLWVVSAGVEWQTLTTEEIASHPPGTFFVPPVLDPFNLPHRRIVSVSPAQSGLVKCIAVDSPSSMFLAGHGAVPTHNTELILNFIGYKMHASPGLGLVVYPDEDSARMFSEDRLDKMISESPALKKLVGKRRSSGNRVGHKEFPGGAVDIVSGRDPMEIASRPKEWVLFDEINLLIQNIPGSGNPRKLAIRRMETAPAAWKAIYVCSPTVAGKCTISDLYRESDMRKPFLPCPHCGFEQVLTWKDIWWNKDLDENGNVIRHYPETAAVRCQNPECAKLWTEPQRRAAPRYAIWRQTRPFVCCGHHQDPMVTKLWDYDARTECGYAVCDTCGERAVSNHHAGLHVWRVHSPWRHFKEVVQEFLAVKDRPDELQTFVNTVLAEEWEDARKFETTAEILAARREVYHAEVPAGVGLLTAGIDTHENRLEVEVVGWGADEESWGIDRRVLAGDPNEQGVWDQLDALLTKQWTREDGRTLAIMAACIDYGGHRGQAVAGFCIPRTGRRVWAVRGKSEATDKRAPVWPRKPTLRTRGRFPLYEVGTNAAKDLLFSRIDRMTPGAGFMHFPHHYDLESLEQLTVEKLVRKRNGRNSYEVWEAPSGKRNESTDCRVYAYAALEGLKAQGLQVNRAVQNSGAATAPAPAQLASDASNLPAPPRPPVPAGGLADRARAAAPVSDLETGAKSGKLDVENREPPKSPLKAPVRKPVLMPRRSSRW